MDLLQGLLTALRIWHDYGSDIETADAIFNEVAALENGQLFNKVDAILKKYGIDVVGLLGQTGAVPDLTSITGIQHALNLLNPPEPVTEDGIFSNELIAAIKIFQQSQGLMGKDIDGLPGEQTVKLLAAALAKLNS